MYYLHEMSKTLIQFILMVQSEFTMLDIGRASVEVSTGRPTKHFVPGSKSAVDQEKIEYFAIGLDVKTKITYFANFSVSVFEPINTFG